MGRRVRGVALQAENGGASFFTHAHVEKGMNSTLGDIRDLRSVLKAFHQRKPGIVFHNAAQALVLRSYQEPIGTDATNVMGTRHVLQAARQPPSERAVAIVTTD